MTIQQKTQEISLALITVSVAARRSEFRQRIEHLAFALLEAMSEGDHEKILAMLEKAEIFVGFGRLIYEIEPINAKILIEECGNAANIIRQSSGFQGKNDIASLFSQGESIDSLTKTQNSDGNMREKTLKSHKQIRLKLSKKNNPVPLRGISRSETIEGDNPAIRQSGNEVAISSDWSNAAIRQSAIVGKIRQSGNRETQLRDIIAGFDGVSERTLRYDLQKLCGQGVLERIGSGGPSTYYKIRQI